MYLAEMFEELRVGAKTRHTSLYNQFSKTFTASRVSNNEQRNIQLNANHLEF